MNLNSYIKETFTTPVGISKLSTNGNKQPYLHWHPHYEMLVIVSGSYTLTSHTFNYTSDRPAVFIHRPFCLHKLNSPTDGIYVRYIIHIEKNLLSMFSPQLLDMSCFADAAVLRADPNAAELSELVSLCESIKLHGGDKTAGALYCALALHKTLGIFESGRGELFATRYSYIQDVLQYITDNLSEPLTIDELCRRFGVGHTKLSSDFKSAVGTTYKKYVCDLRQSRARELLESGAGIIDASLEVGYSSEAHFIKAFREYWGETPGRFMRQLQNPH